MKRKSPLPFGLSVRDAVIGALVVLVFFGGTLWALNSFSPGGSTGEGRPALAPPPPLKPATRTSTVVAPVAIAATAIRDVLEAHAPRTADGKRDNPVGEFLRDGEIAWTMTRGPLAVATAPPRLNITTALNGSIKITGQVSEQTGNVADALSGLLGNKLSQRVKTLAGRSVDQRADIRGEVAISARPALLSNWRFEPNLGGQVTLADGGLAVGGLKLNVAKEIKPLLDEQVNAQIGRLSEQLRTNPMLELAVRREWTKLCRSISLAAAAKDAPPLWLEVRPTKAFAAQPLVVPDWLVLTVGVEAETRIVPNQTKPNCPFPAKLDLVPRIDNGKIAIAMPIEMPFTELNRVLQAQLVGKTFQDGKTSAGQVTVLAANLAASGERLLVSLRVKAKENKTWFGFGGEATLHIWGKPVLDRDNQTMRLTDMALDVQSEAAFGVLGAAARAAIPYLQESLEKSAVIDLKPFAASARKSVEAALADFRKPADGVEVEASVSDIRLVGIEFDDKTLRVTAEAQGTARARVRKLAFQ